MNLPGGGQPLGLLAMLGVTNRIPFPNQVFFLVQSRLFTVRVDVDANVRAAVGFNAFVLLVIGQALI